MKYLLLAVLAVPLITLGSFMMNEHSVSHQYFGFAFLVTGGGVIGVIAAKADS